MAGSLRARLPEFRVRGWGWAVLGLSLAFVALRLFMSREMESPFIFSDEIGYLLNARFLSGIDPSPEHPYVPFYAIGYSMLLAPLSWVFEHPIGVYHGALVVNALLGGATIPVLYAIAREVIGLVPKHAVLAAGLAGAYPAFLVNANIAWAENLLPLLVALQVLFAYRTLTRDSFVWPAGVAVTAVALYVTHPRTLPIVAVTILLFGIAGLRGLMSRVHAAAAFGLLAAGGIVGKLLTDHVRNEVYRGPVGGGPSKTEGTADFVLQSVEEPSVYGNAVVRGLGQAWYMCATSAGLWALGLGLLAALVWRGRRQSAGQTAHARAYVAGFAVLGVLASFIPNALIFASTEPNLFFSVYGRYMESVSPVVLLAGAAAVLTIQGRRQRLMAVGAAAAFTLVLTLVVHIDSPMLEKSPINPAALLSALVPAGVSNWIDLIGFDLLRATALGLLGMAIFAAVPARRAALAVVVVGAAFVASGLVAAERIIQPFAAGLTSHETLQSTIEGLPPGEPVSFELSSYFESGMPQYQYLVDDRKFLLYDERLGGRPRTPVVVGKLSDERMRREGARVVAFETHRDQALWIRPSRLLRRYEAAGRVFPSSIGARLPARARHALFTVRPPTVLPVRIPTGGMRALSLAVTHSGRGSPWRQPGTSPATAGHGSVSITAGWLRANGKGKRLTAQYSPLPRTLAPGATVNVGLTLLAVDAAGRPFPPGRYIVELTPMQNDYNRYFSDDGDDGMRIPIEVTGG